MSVEAAQATTLLENVLFESPDLAAANAASWVASSAANADEASVAGLAAAMAATPEAGIVQQVVRYYEGALGRAPGGSEVQYYVNIAEAGLTPAQIAAGPTSVPLTSWNQIAADFANSPEFSFASAGSNTVSLLYLNILSRSPSASEAAYYDDQLAAGFTATNLIQEFTNSPEFQSQVDTNISAGLASYGSAVASGTTPPILALTLPTQTIAVTLGLAAVTVTGATNTGAVIVTGSPASAGQVAQTAVTGVIGVTAVAAASGVQPVVGIAQVIPQTAQSAVAAVIDGPVTITDAAYASGGTGTITSITLANAGPGSVINDSAVTSLTLTGTTGSVTLNSAASNGASLTLTLNGLTAASNQITDSNNEISSLAIVTTGADSSLTGFGDSNLTSLTVSGSNKLTLSTINGSLTALAITGSASFSDGATLHGRGLAALGSNLTITDSSSGSFSAVLDDTSQSFTGGSGADIITVSDLTDATKTITAGSATTNEIIFEGGVYGLTSASSGKFVNFQTVGVMGNVSGVIDLSVIDATASGLEVFGANGGITFAKVASGATLLLDPSAGATVTVDYVDSTGVTDHATVTMSSAIASLSLQDSLGVGIGTLTIVNTLRNSETNISPAHIIYTLADNDLTNLTVSGNAGLTIGTLTESTSPAASFTLTNNSTDGYGVTINSLTDAALTSLAFIGTGISTVSALTDQSASLTVSNTANTQNFIGTITDNALSTLTLGANVALGQASSALTSNGLQDGLTTGVKVAAASDNAHVTVNLNAGAVSGKTDSVTLGNGNNVVVDSSTAGTVTVTLGSGANLVELGSGNSDSTALYSVILAARTSTAPNIIVVGAAGTNYASAPNIVISGVTASDLIGFGNDTASSSNSVSATVLTSATSVAGAIGLLEAAATVAHQVVYGVYGGNTYLVETATGSLGSSDTTVIEITGAQSLTAASGHVALGSPSTVIGTPTLPVHSYTIAAGTATNLSLGANGTSVTLLGSTNGVSDIFTSNSLSTGLTINYQASSGADTIVMAGSGGSNQSDLSSLLVNDTSAASAGLYLGSFTDNNLTSVTYNDSAASGATVSQAALISSSLTVINLSGGVAGKATNVYFISATLSTSSGVTINDTNLGSGATTMGLTLNGGPSSLTMNMTGPGTLATGALSDDNLNAMVITGSGTGTINIGTLTDGFAGTFTVTDSDSSTGPAVIVLDGLSAATTLIFNDSSAGTLSDSSAYSDASLTTLSLTNTGAAAMSVGTAGITANSLTAITVSGSSTGSITTGAISDGTSSAVTLTDSDSSTGAVSIPLTGLSSAISLTVIDSAAGSLSIGTLSDNSMTSLSITDSASASLTVGAVTANALSSVSITDSASANLTVGAVTANALTSLSLTNSGSATLTVGAISSQSLTSLTLVGGTSASIVVGAISDSVASGFTINDSLSSTTSSSLSISSLPNATSVSVSDHSAGALTIGAFTDTAATSLDFANYGTAALTASVTDSSPALSLSFEGSHASTQSITLTDAGATSLTLTDSDASTGSVTLSPTLIGGPASLVASDSGSGAFTVGAFTDANLTSVSLSNTGNSTLTLSGVTNTTAVGAGLFTSLSLAGSGAISASLALANTASTVAINDSDSGAVTVTQLNIGSAAANSSGLTITNSNSASGSLTVSSGTDYLDMISLINSSPNSAIKVTLTDAATTATTLSLSGGTQTLNITDNSAPLTFNLGNGTNTVNLTGSTSGALSTFNVTGTGSNNITLVSGHATKDILNFSTTLGSNTNTIPVTADVIKNFTGDSGTTTIGDSIALGFTGANILNTNDANSQSSSFWTSTNGMFTKTGASVLNFISDVQSLTQAGGVANTSGIAGFSDGTNTWIAYNDHSGSNVSVIELLGVVYSGIEASSISNNFVHIA